MVEGHQKKDVKYALKFARDSGFLIEEVHKGHTWGFARCPDCGLKIKVSCTPKNEGAHAKWVRRRVDRCLRRHSRPGSEEEA